MDNVEINLGYEILQKQSSIARGKITCKDEIRQIDSEMKQFVGEYPDFKPEQFATLMENAKKRNIEAF